MKLRRLLVYCDASVDNDCGVVGYAGIVLRQGAIKPKLVRGVSCKPVDNVAHAELIAISNAIESAFMEIVTPEAFSVRVFSDSIIAISLLDYCRTTTTNIVPSNCTAEMYDAASKIVSRLKLFGDFSVEWASRKRDDVTSDVLIDMCDRMAKNQMRNARSKRQELIGKVNAHKKKRGAI